MLTIAALRRAAAGFGIFAATAVSLSAPAPVLAANATVPPPMPAPATQEDWYLTIGLSGRVVPQYPGSDDYTVRPGLVFRVAKASSLNAFRSVDDNPSVALFDTGTFRVGAVGRIDWGRDEDANDRLTGLGNVDPSIEIGGFTEWFPVTWLRLRGELRYGFGGYEGWVGNAAADLIVPIDQWRFAVGPRLSFASSAFNEAYFGVTPFQALSANFLGNPVSVYNAGSGINGWGVTAQLERNFGNGFLAGVWGSYGRIVGSAADSPLVEDANQYSVGLSIAYTFHMGKSWW